jgi:hypothetical protein
MSSDRDGKATILKGLSGVIAFRRMAPPFLALMASWLMVAAVIIGVRL